MKVFRNSPSPVAGRPRHLAVLGLAAWCLVNAACGTMAELPGKLFDGRTPRERYEDGLELAGLGETAMVRDWLTAAERALAEAPLITTPHREEGVLLPGEPTAVAFRIGVRRGQEVHFEVQLLDDSTTTLFLEAWQIQDDSARTHRTLTVADSGQRSLRVEPRRDGELLFRVQPELLRGGRFVATVTLEPTLAFPVKGGRESDIGSRFGAERDGGARSHHGIDIFARRGTPALAASRARVTRVQTTPRGGNVVWLRDERGNSLYYAHLDRQTVVEGRSVAPGDTVGYVGNTGNAITTPPHLHFGVYRRGMGPIDPFWFVHQPRDRVQRLAADTTSLGDWIRTGRDGVTLRREPRADANALRTLPEFTTARVIAAVGEWYRVRLPDGTGGYLRARLAEAVLEPLSTGPVSPGSLLLAEPPAPAGGSPLVIGEVQAGDTVAVLGRFASYLYVRGQAGQAGWMSE